MTVTASVDSLREVLGHLAERFAADAWERDRDRRLPHAELAALSEAGVLSVTVPRAFGGAGGGVADAVETTRVLAAADPSIAQVPQSQFLYLRLAEIVGGERLQAELFGTVLAGARIANAQSERGGRDVTDVRTRVTFSGDRAHVTGEKFYSTGSLFADWLAVLARDADGVDHVAYLPASTPGVSVVDDWAGMGQRTTGSGTVRLDDVVVPRDFVVPRAPAVSGPYGYGTYAQAVHAAIDTGIARGALDDAAAFVRTSSRPWFEAGVERAQDDPLLVQRFGALEVAVRAAETTLAAGAIAVDRAFAARDDAHATEAALAVATAKVLADRAALDVTNALFELAGTRSADERLGLHRHWRNARTHTLHDPVRWKLQHLGRWSVAGVAPPRTAQL